MKKETFNTHWPFNYALKVFQKEKMFKRQNDKGNRHYTDRTKIINKLSQVISDFTPLNRKTSHAEQIRKRKSSKINRQFTSSFLNTNLNTMTKIMAHLKSHLKEPAVYVL